jgi:hypothetical protein
VESFSFIYHPFVQLHQTIPSLLPGIEKVITVHFDQTDRMIKGMLTEKVNKSYETKNLNIDKILPTLQKYMEVKTPFDWCNKQNLPFEIETKKSTPSLDIFSELQNIVLLLRIPDAAGEFNDLVYLYLNENPSNFGVTNSINPLTTDNKSIIAFLLYNTVKALVNQDRTNRKVLIKNNFRTRDIISKAETMKYEMNFTNENYGLSLVKLCQNYIQDWTKRTGIQYKLSSGALDKIKNYKGDIRDFERIVENTVNYVNSLYLDDLKEVEILEWHLQMTPQVPKRPAVEISKETPADKYARTMQLLDKLEDAALKVKTNNLKMTGTNVGQAIPSPISAPAISDALYNHKGKINRLMNQYPEKWNIIRNEFKPLQNILKKEETSTD